MRGGIRAIQKGCLRGGEPSIIDGIRAEAREIMLCALSSGS